MRSIEKKSFAVREKLPLSIVIADDEVDILEELAVMLRKRVAVVHTALNGKEGLDSFMNHSIDAIISDVDMPIMNGIDFLKSVRGHNEHIPFIISTGLKNQDIMIDAIEYGASSFLIKPINVQKLFARLERIAHLKSAEEKIQISNDLLDQYKSVVDYSSIVSKADLNGSITYVNEMFCAISGYSQDELIGRPHSIVRDPRMPSDVYRAMWKTIQSKNVWKGTIHNRAKDGSRYTVKTTITPILDKVGNIVEYIGLREDITEVERAKNEAKASAKIKGEFLANMSHEIRTPMNGILGFTTLLLNCNTLNEQEKKYVNIINDSSQTLMGIINDILDFSKLESGKFDLDYTPIKPFIEFDKIIQLFSAQIAKKKINLTVAMDSLIGKGISMDLLRIQQVISNLLSNAIKFTPEHGAITFYAQLEKHQHGSVQMRVGIKDNGVGIPQTMLENIFQPFTQADASVTRKFGGTGLGLSISSHLISMMGGKLQVQSKEGAGSDFYFDLPVKIVKIKESLAAPTISKENTQFIGKVLVAEDNEVNQLFIAEQLRQFNLVPVITSNGQEALDELELQSYDLILMDIQMPIMDGMHALRNIKEKGIKTPVIALTANAMAGDQERFLGCGFDNYLSKPIVVNELQNVLRTYLEEEKSHIISVPMELIPPDEIEAILNMECLQKEFSLSKEVIHKLLKVFLASIDPLLSKLKMAIESRNYNQIESIAHNLKGSSSNLRLHPIVKLAQTIEKDARMQQEVDYEEVYNQLDSLFTTVKHEIGEVING